MSPSQQPPSPSYPTELTTAIHAVHLASLLTKSHLLNHLSSKSSSAPDSGNVTASTKSDNSEVTVADFASQAIIISIIHAAFPDDVFIAEESGGMLRRDEELRGRVWKLLSTAREVSDKYVRNGGRETQDGMVDGKGAELKLPESEEKMIAMIDLGQVGGRSDGKGGTGRTWILDPIDGTKTYIRGQQYVVCLCLVDQDEQQVAVMGCPNLKLDAKDDEGRVLVEEELVDLDGDGGWIVSCVRGEGVKMSELRQPFGIQDAGDILGWSDAEDTINDTTDTIPDTNNTISLRFTDSTASPHVSMDLHNRVFTHFSSSPSSSAPLNIWSMQLKFILLALRVSGADAMVRVPPQTDYHASVWDHAGGQLLVRESGGVLTDAHGVPFVLDGKTRKLVKNWGVVAVRGGVFMAGTKGKIIHGEVLSRVKEEVEKRGP